MDDVVVVVGQSAGAIDGVFDEDFVHAGAANGHRPVRAAEQVVCGESHAFSGLGDVATAEHAAAQAHFAIVKNIAFIVDDGAPSALIAHRIHGVGQGGGVGRGRDDAEVLFIGDRPGVLDFDHGARGRSGGWPRGKRGGGGGVTSLHIKLDGGIG